MAQTGNAAHKVCDSLRFGLLILFRSARFSSVRLGSTWFSFIKVGLSAVCGCVCVWVGVQGVASAADLQALKPFVELN